MKRRRLGTLGVFLIACLVATGLAAAKVQSNGGGTRQPLAASGCQLNSAQGNIHHVIYVQFDNTHFRANTLGASEVSGQISCSPFDTLYSSFSLSVTATMRDGNLHVAVGFAGSDEAAWCGNFATGNVNAAAKAAVNAIASIVDLRDLYAAAVGT